LWIEAQELIFYLYGLKEKKKKKKKRERSLERKV
jgi:hypothetical protein